MSSTGGDLLPEKFAMYFSTMNSLASKVYADIEGVEDYIKAHGPSSIAYNEKCNIVDKFLIYDHLNKNDANGKLNKKLTHFQKYQFNKSETSLNSILDHDKCHAMINETELLQPVFYNDSILDQDHETTLLTSVAPKKPEKYVYDDNNYWIDEHSVPYSSCTPTQAKACKLQHFLDSLPPPPQVNRRSDHSHKYRAPPIPTQVQPEEGNQASYITKPTNERKANVENDRYSRIDKMESENSKNKPVVRVPLFGGMFGDEPVQGKPSKPEDDARDPDDLPNQVQNKDLIAELQAKLKKGNNKKHDSSASRIADGISPRSSTKLNKPKAPPPPPPGSKVPGSAVKVTTNTAVKEQGFHKNGQSKSMGREISDEFVVDISSPCKIATPKTGLDFLDNW